jgi:hypothetical protein
MLETHLLITLGDDRRPTWINEELARRGRKRTVAVRVRYFMPAPLVVAKSDLLLIGPAMLLRYFAELVPLQILEPPIALPTYAEQALWHERFDEDPGTGGCATCCAAPRKTSAPARARRAVPGTSHR